MPSFVWFALAKSRPAARVSRYPPLLEAVLSAFIGGLISPYYKAATSCFPGKKNREEEENRAEKNEKRRKRDDGVSGLCSCPFFRFLSFLSAMVISVAAGGRGGTSVSLY